jgi:hypothetical protein
VLILNCFFESLFLLNHQYQVPAFIIFPIHIFTELNCGTFSTSRSSQLIEISLFSSRLLSASPLQHSFRPIPAAYSRGFRFLFLPRNPAVIFMESARSLRRAETAIAMPKADEPKARSRKDAGTKFAWGRRQPGHSAEVDNVDSRERLRRSEVLESKSTW